MGDAGGRNATRQQVFGGGHRRVYVTDAALACRQAPARLPFGLLRENKPNHFRRLAFVRAAFLILRPNYQHLQPPWLFCFFGLQLPLLSIRHGPSKFHLK
jgi:hypothetical protein